MPEEVTKVIDNNEVLKSVRDNIDDKIRNPIWGFFLISWAVVHWNFLYAVFFLSEEKIWLATGGRLKNDYLREIYFDFSHYETWLLFIFPFLLTWFFIKTFPKYVSIPAYKISNDFENEKAKIKLQSIQDILQYKLQISKTKEEKTRVEKNIKKEEEDIKRIDPTFEWKKELAIAIKDKQMLDAMNTAQKIIYQTLGRFTTKPGEGTTGYKTFISSKLLSRLDVLGLVVLSENEMKFTEKGKFFLKELIRLQPPLE